ncbi:Major facilitator superfamily [Rhodospirillaceae bacterium LM-1]|nr:Major facilitator superfamily [Rhodospirillaceae bacterium LM-1]
MSFQPSPLGLAARVFLPFAGGYFLSYLYRSVNAVIAPDLVGEIGLSPADLGLLTSTYFLTFGLAQLPLGILLDRFGPRRVEAALLVIAALGAAVFAMASAKEMLIFGRGLIGLGVAACLMASMKGFTQWYASERLPLVNGLLLGCGGLGALAATAPVEFALQHTGWRNLFLLLAAATLLASAIIFFVMPDKKNAPGASQPESVKQQIGALKSIFKSPVFWGIAPGSALIQASFMGIQGLWAGPWLRDVAGLSRPEVAGHLFAMAGAVAVGFVSMGLLADWLRRHKISPLTISLAGMILFLLVQLALVLRATSLALPLCLLFGFLGTSGALNYASLNQLFPPSMAGRVATSFNLLVFAATFACQWGMGAVIGLWPAENGHYDSQAYAASFGLMLGLQVIGVGWIVYSRKRHKL